MGSRNQYPNWRIKQTKAVNGTKCLFNECLQSGGKKKKKKKTTTIVYQDRA